MTFDARRILTCSLLAAVVGLCARLSGIGGRWEFFALLAALAGLIGMGPLHMMSRAKAGVLTVMGLATLLANGLRVAWAAVQVARQDTEIRRQELQTATIEHWQQVGFDSLMGRFRYQYQRGAAVSQRTNES